jgi:hypothetical protein
VTAWFSGNGLDLHGVAVATPSLEEAFFALTGETADAE